MSRDRYVPKHPTPLTGVPAREWHEEDTGVHTDAQVFRALKGLHDDFTAHKAAITTEVTVLTGRFDAFEDRTDRKLDRVLAASERALGQIDAMGKRPRSDSGKTELANQVLADAREGKKFRNELTLKIVGGLFSAGVLGTVIGYLLGGCA